MYVNDRRVISKDNSIWWRDLIMINGCKNSMSSMLLIFFIVGLKYGKNLSFRFSRWARNQSILEALPELYVKVVPPFMYVVEAGFWIGSEWVWDTNYWLKEEDVDDHNMLLSLTNLLHKFKPQQFIKDWCYWAVDEEVGFTVKAYVAEIRKRGNGVGYYTAVLRELNFIWELKVP